MTIKRAKPSGTNPSEVRRALGILDLNFQQQRAEDIKYDDTHSIKDILDSLVLAIDDDEIIAKINAASAQITRASSVAAAARPIGTGEVGSTEIATAAIKTKLAAEADGNKLTTSELAAAASLVNSQMATLIADLAGKLAAAAFSGLTKITVGETEPTSPSAGDLWVDTN